MASPIRFKCEVAASVAQGAMQSFTNAASKIGDINALNKIGGGQVAGGLRSLVSVSNSIRTGCGSLPASIGNSITAGGSYVLDAVGISPSAMSAVGNINPGAVNAAQGQAEQIYNKVKQGNFKLSDVAGSAQDLQHLTNIAAGIYPTPKANTAVSVKCLTSPYAMDLVGLAPKYKFLFLVQFIPYSGYETLETKDFAFVVKKSSRPSTKFIMDDVNYYNFRTKVTTRVEQEEMTMSFHDDIKNSAMVFYNTYRNAMSPITNMDHNTFFTAPEESGMDFTTSTILADSPKDAINMQFNRYSASRGPLLEDNMNVFREIKLYHIYDYGRMANIYQFLNPRITAMDLDEVDMSAGTEGNEVSIKFNYDNVYIQTGIMVESDEVTDSAGIMPGQEHALNPLRNNPDVLAMDIAHTNATKATPKADSSCDTPSKVDTKSAPSTAITPPSGNAIIASFPPPGGVTLNA
jgi:hypothetical protein